MHGARSWAATSIGFQWIQVYQDCVIKNMLEGALPAAPQFMAMFLGGRHRASLAGGFVNKLVGVGVFVS